MRRDMELIRELLLRLEALPLGPHSLIHVRGSDEEMAIEGRSPDEIEYHLDLLREAGLIECPGSQPLAGGVIFRRLSWEGHDFIDTVRDNEVWSQTKDTAKKAGSGAIEFVWGIAKEITKAEIKRRTGFDVG